MFCIGYYKFSTEDFRLATGASAPVARKQNVFVIFYRGNIEENVHCFYCFSATKCPPSPPLASPPVKIPNFR